MSAPQLLEDLQSWYSAQADGDWEHQFGIRIESLDNPGWYVHVDLAGTYLAGKPFHLVERKTPENDWINCGVEAEVFSGIGGPHNLAEILQIFIDWAKTEPNWLAIPPPPTQADHDRALLAQLVEMGYPAVAEACRCMGCTEQRLRNSAFCPDHHFEMLRGRLPSDAAT